ncbi:MAG: hypothetical protein ABL308_14695 [Oceanicaulis sp.]
MNIDNALSRLEAVREALAEAEPTTRGPGLLPGRKPGKPYDWFVAAAAMRLDGAPHLVARKVLERQDEIVALQKASLARRGWLGRRKWLIDLLAFVPSRAVWTGGAISLGCGLDIEHYREITLAGPSTDDIALAMTLCGVDPARAEATGKAVFAEMRASGRAIEDAAALYLTRRASAPGGLEAYGDAAARAEAAFEKGGAPGKARKAGGQICAALDLDPEGVLGRYQALDAARKDHRALNALKADRLAEWAALGLDPDGLAMIAGIAEKLGRRAQSDKQDRLLLAHLVYRQAAEGADDFARHAAVFSGVYTARSTADGGGGP